MDKNFDIEERDDLAPHLRRHLAARRGTVPGNKKK